MTQFLKKQFDKWLQPRMSSCDKLELLSCVANGSLARLSELLQAGANPSCTFDDGSSLLHNLAVSESISEKDRSEVFSLLVNNQYSLSTPI